VVGTSDVGVNFCIYQPVGEPVADKEVIDTPADISLSCSCAVAPPAVCIAALGVKKAESVDESAVEQRGHALAFLVGEACALTVCLRICKVYFLMCAVQVAAHNDRLF